MLEPSRRPERELRVIRLLNPTFCSEVNCPFLNYKRVVYRGAEQVMRYCTRRDCDNWDLSVPSEEVEVIDE